MAEPHLATTGGHPLGPLHRQGYQLFGQFDQNWPWTNKVLSSHPPRSRHMHSKFICPTICFSFLRPGVSHLVLCWLGTASGDRKDDSFPGRLGNSSRDSSAREVSRPPDGARSAHRCLDHHILWHSGRSWPCGFHRRLCLQLLPAPAAKSLSRGPICRNLCCFYSVL